MALTDIVKSNGFTELNHKADDIVIYLESYIATPPHKSTKGYNMSK
uniref:Uncharacterized protein n=1 Tax=Arundo donax TaxID=35708 RepID=A0A0A8YYT5_ARUDO